MKEAAKMLGLSARTIYDYVEEGRLPGARMADVIAISVEDLLKFKRDPSGRPRTHTPLWRISSGENDQFMTLVLVQERTGQHDVLIRKLEMVRKRKQHLFPGTVMRYVVEGGASPRQIILVFAWRGTVMPDRPDREKALEEFRRAFSDVLDWSTAQHIDGQVLMHT